MDGISIAALTLVLTRFLVLIPTMIFGLFLFHKYRNTQLIQHRNPSLINIINIVTILTIAVERTFMISAFVWNILPVKIWVVYFMQGVFWWALFALFGIKVYLLYYQQQYHLSILEQVWKSDINPETVNFYIANKHKWGSAKWLGKVCFIPYIISCTAAAALPHLFGHGIIVDFLPCAVISPPICVAFYVIYKTRRLKDVWGIGDETVLQALLVFSSLCIYSIAFLYLYTQKYGLAVYRFNWTLYSFIGDIGAVAFGIIPMFYPIYLIKKGAVIGNLRLMNGYLSDGYNVDSVCLMNKIMVKYDSFKLFMQYLVSEFTSENGLFLVELIQIKHNYQKQNKFIVQLSNPSDYSTYLQIDFNLNPLNGNEYESEQERYFTYLFDESGYIRSKISLPIQVPKSIILTQNKKDNICKNMVSLYNKYVAVDRLNISHKVRNELDKVFNNSKDVKDEHIVFNAMDGCAAEILLLLRRSFARFITKDSVASLLEEIKNEDENKSDHQPRSDIKMKELLNSNTNAIVTKKELIHFYN